jgi:hypothetical protein
MDKERGCSAKIPASAASDLDDNQVTRGWLDGRIEVATSVISVISERIERFGGDADRWQANSELLELFSEICKLLLQPRNLAL